MESDRARTTPKALRWVTALALALLAVVFGGFAGFEAFYPGLANSAEPSPPTAGQRALRIGFFAVAAVACGVGSVRALRR